MKEHTKIRLSLAFGFLGLLLLLSSIQQSQAAVSTSGGMTTWSYTLPNADALEYAQAFVWAYQGDYTAYLCNTLNATPGSCAADTDLRKGQFVDVKIKGYAREVHQAHQKYLHEQAYSPTAAPALT